MHEVDNACDMCKYPFDEPAMKMAVFALNRYWHVQCFRCVQCRELLNPKGTHVMMSQKNLPLCTQCHSFERGCSRSHSGGRMDPEPAIRLSMGRTQSPSRIQREVSPHGVRHSVSKSATRKSISIGREPTKSGETNRCHKCGQRFLRGKHSGAEAPTMVHDAALKPRRYHRSCLTCDGCGEQFIEDEPQEQNGFILCTLCATHLSEGHICSIDCARRSTCCIELNAFDFAMK